jgi:hypothetical protein
MKDRANVAAAAVTALIENHCNAMHALRLFIELVGRSIDPSQGTKPTTEEWTKVVEYSRLVISEGQGDA